MRELTYEEIMSLNTYELVPITFITVVMKALGYTNSTNSPVRLNVMVTEKLEQKYKKNSDIFKERVCTLMSNLRRENSKRYNVWIPGEPEDFEFRLV